MLDVDLGGLPRRHARGIVRVGSPSELDDPFVRFLHPHQIRLQPRGFADAENEQASGERIEGAGVSDLLDLRAPPELLDDVVRCDTGFLVDEQQAVDFGLGCLHGA